MVCKGPPLPQPSPPKEERGAGSPRSRMRTILLPLLPWRRGLGRGGRLPENCRRVWEEAWTVGCCLGTAIELRGARVNGLLSPTLSSKGGEGEDPLEALGKTINGNGGLGRGGRYPFRCGPAPFQGYHIGGAEDFSVSCSGFGGL